MQVDIARNRIALTMRLDDEVEQKVNKEANNAEQHKSSRAKNHKQNRYHNKSQGQNKSKAGQPVTAMAAAFANMKK